MSVHERCLRRAYQISICKRKGIERSYNTSFIILRIAHIVWTGVAVFPCEVSRPVEGTVFTACSKYETASERPLPLLVFQVAAPAGTTTRRASSYRALTPPTTPALTTTSPTATSGSTPCACPRLVRRKTSVSEWWGKEKTVENVLRNLRHLWSLARSPHDKK